MKTNFTILTLFAYSVSFGQVRLEPIQPKPAATTDTMANETIAHCDAMIAAIDYKVDFVSKDITQKAEAEKTGWFKQMAHHRACFAARREELVKRGLTK